MDPSVLVVPAFVILAIVIRLLAGSMDHDRIRQYVAQRGGTVLDLKWSPLGPGWFTEKSDRIYVVWYLDMDGNEHEAHCKTSMWTGVYFTEDHILQYAERPAPPETPAETALKAENHRLRQELKQFRRERRKAKPDDESEQQET